MALTSQADAKRFDRLVSVRQTFATVAESHVREAEAEVRKIETLIEGVDRKIRQAREEVTHRPMARGQDYQQVEQYVEVLKKHRARLLVTLDKAKEKLAHCTLEWTEARRESKVVERLQERRLQEWQRQEDVALQKSADEAFIGRLVRARK